MNRFRERMAVFMRGRYGMDQLGKVLSFGTIIILLLSTILQVYILYIVGMIALVLGYFRIFSRNIGKRYEENQKFLNWRYKIVCKKSKIMASIKDRRTNSIFNCPNCQQKIRVPKGKGKISIKCPKCRIEFVKKT